MGAEGAPFQQHSQECEPERDLTRIAISDRIAALGWLMVIGARGDDWLLGNFSGVLGADSNARWKICAKHRTRFALDLRRLASRQHGVAKMDSQISGAGSAQRRWTRLGLDAGNKQLDRADGVRVASSRECPSESSWRHCGEETATWRDSIV